MSGPEAQRRDHFTLSAPPPVRALAITAAGVAVGVVLLVLRSELRWPVGVSVVGVVLVVLAVALGVLALITTSRARTVVRTDAEQITITRVGRSTTMRWADVGEVAVTGHRLVLRERTGERTAAVLNPRVRANPTFLALMTEIQQRLDADRGYSPLT